MLLARNHLGMAEGQNTNDDGSLSVTAEPFSDKLFLRGTASMFKKWDDIAALVDSDGEEVDEGTEIEALTLRNYAIYSDPALAFALLQTMLEGRDHMKMGQDEATGAIMVRGRKDDHRLVEETLTTLSDQGDNFAIIDLENADPTEIIVLLQNLFRQSPDSPEAGPVLMGNSERKQIIVRGTPQEVALVRKMVADIDLSSIPVVQGPRTTRRIISMGEREQEDVMPILEDMLFSVGRTNKLNIIQPEDRKDIRKRLITPSADESDPLNLHGDPSSSNEPGSRRMDVRRYKSSQFNSRMMESGLILSQFAGVNPFVLTSGLLQGVDEDLGKTSAESDEDSKYLYKPAPQVLSVAGAPIEVRFTSAGIVLDSKDLDALDDLEDQIYNRIGEDTVVQLPTFFLLKYRDAGEMLTLLENYFGMSDSGGGGGGGGGGGLLGGMMDNVMGGAGDLLGGNAWRWSRWRGGRRS